MWRKLRNLQHLDRPILAQIILAVVWITVLSWGEHRSFANSAKSCQWAYWEDWPADAQPHHLVFVADPQLVDPHTYPGRPWPLSSLTVRHTDQYMRRAFTAIQDHLDPQTVLFLGDLFDGGREWSTKASKSPEKRWHKYDTQFWLGEYARFGKIFLEPWVAAMKKQGPRRDQRFLANLPGNHDFGFSTGIQLPVRTRFQTFFGESNRVDIIGNHSFVSVDTVSLSARNKEPGNDNDTLWQSTEEFVHNSKDRKAEALDRQMRLIFNTAESQGLHHSVVDTDKLGNQEPRAIGAASGEMPTVLLTHVPLYRDPATPCGPLRERWPPSKMPSESEPPMEKDERNAIKIHGGYQYQNVLDQDISNELVEKIGRVEHVFSGDDHDYCEVFHKGYAGSGGVRELTVKSLSWAMGVRKPGFLLVSLWNPVDQQGTSLPQAVTAEQKYSAPTLQSHLCLLPDQLNVFIRYLFLLLITIGVLAIDALLGSPSSKGSRETYEPLLPVVSSNAPRTARGRTRADSTSFSTSNNSDQSQLASRSAASRAKPASPAQGYGYGIPRIAESESDALANYQRSMELANGRNSPEKQVRAYTQNAPLTKTQAFSRRFRNSFLRVAFVGLLWYIWLALTV